MKVQGRKDPKLGLQRRNIIKFLVTKTPESEFTNVPPFKIFTIFIKPTQIFDVGILGRQQTMAEVESNMLL